MDRAAHAIRSDADLTRAAIMGRTATLGMAALPVTGGGHGVTAGILRITEGCPAGAGNRQVETHALGLDPRVNTGFSLGTNAKPCPEIML